MPIFKVNPVKALQEATEKAYKAPGPRTLAALQSTIQSQRDAALSQPGGQEALVEAFGVLISLLAQSLQWDEVRARLIELRKLSFGRAAALDQLSTLIDNKQDAPESIPLLLSDWLLEESKADEAARRLEVAVGRLGRRPLLMERWGDALLAAGRLPDAVRCYCQVMDLAPEEAFRLENKFCTITESAPELAVAWRARGRIAYRQQDFASAIVLFEEARGRAELDPPALLELADAYIFTSRPEEACDVFECLLNQPEYYGEILQRCERILEQCPNHWRVFRLQGDIFTHQDRAADAVEALRKGLEAVALGSQPAEQAATFLPRLEILLEKLPESGEVHLARAIGLRLVGNFLAAHSAALEARRISPEQNPLIARLFQEIVQEAPHLFDIRLDLADVQIEISALAEAQETLETALRDHPDRHTEVEQGFRHLLEVLEALGPDSTLVSTPWAPVLRKVLHVLARETAPTNPIEAVTFLSRLLIFASEETAAIREALDSLDLLTTLPGPANLLLGDTFRIDGDLEQARCAYQAIPPGTVEFKEHLARWDLLLHADPSDWTCATSAADLCLQMGDLPCAEDYLYKAYTIAPDPASSSILPALEERREHLSAKGTVLLADVYLQQNTPAALNQCLTVLRSLLETGIADKVIPRGESLRRLVATDTQLFADSSLLVGEALLAAGDPRAAFEALLPLVEHQHANLEAVACALQQVVKMAPDYAEAWLALGDVRRRLGEEGTLDALQAYEHALEVDPIRWADEVVRHADGCSSSETPHALAIHLLATRTWQRAGRGKAALERLTEAWRVAGVEAADEVLQHAVKLVDTPEASLLAAEVEMAQGHIADAVSWARKFLEEAPPDVLICAEALLKDMVHRFPSDVEPVILLARLLYRLGRPDEAAREVGLAQTRMPDHWERLRALLEETLEEASREATVWLELARGHADQGEVEQAVKSLWNAIEEPTLLAEAHEILEKMAARHGDRPDLLHLMIETELRLGGRKMVWLSVEHGKKWLELAPEAADRVYAAAERAVAQMEVAKETAITRRAEAALLVARSLLTQGKVEQAAAYLRSLLERLPAASDVVVEWCRETLCAKEILPLRLLLIDVLSLRGRLKEAVEACTVIGEGVERWQALAEKCGYLGEVAAQQSPQLAGEALRQQAQFRSLIGDSTGVAEAIRRATSHSPSLRGPLAAWLTSVVSERAWATPDLQVLLLAKGSLLREQGKKHFDEALQVIYQAGKLALPLQPVLDELDHFPPTYLPACQTAIDLCIQAGPSAYATAFTYMRGVLERFGAEQAADLLDRCAVMDASYPEVSYMQAEILEAAERLDEAASVLLQLLRDRPDQQLQVLAGLRSIAERHPQAWRVRLALVDALLGLGDWEAGLLECERIQEHWLEAATELPPRFGAIADALPNDIRSRWGMAKAHRALGEPSLAAGWVEAVADVDPEQSNAAAAFAADLTEEYPLCSRAWFVRGKLAARAEDHVACISHMEQSLLGDGELPFSSRVALHDMLGRAYHITGELEQAAKHLLEAVRLSPDERELRDALASVRRDQLDREIAKAEAKARRKSASAADWLALGHLLRRRGYLEKAVQAFGKAAEDEALQAEGSILQAECFVDLGLLHVAAAILQRVGEEQPLGKELRKRFLYDAAQVYRRMLEFERALSLLERLSGEDPGYDNVLGLIDIVQREKAEAESQPIPLRPLVWPIPFAEE